MTHAFSYRVIMIGLLSLILTILPIPFLIKGIKPAWTLLFLFYFVFYLSSYFRVIFVLILGLLLDILMGSIIGEHAFALLFTTWLATRKLRRFHFFSFAQQFMHLFQLSLVYLGLLLMINAFIGNHVSFLIQFINSILTVLLWPWVKLFLQSYLPSHEIV